MAGCGAAPLGWPGQAGHADLGVQNLPQPQHAADRHRRHQVRYSWLELVRATLSNRSGDGASIGSLVLHQAVPRDGDDTAVAGPLMIDVRR